MNNLRSARQGHGAIRALGTTLILVVFLLGIALPTSAASTREQAKEEGQKHAQARKEINSELEGLAKDMASLLGHPGFRGLLRSELARSKNREQILESDTFLDKAAGQKGAPPGLQKLRDRAKKTRKLITSSGFWDLDGLDIYFPVRDHRKKWTGNDDILVAFSPVDDEENVAEVVAYSVKSGERVSLDTEVPPETPVLVIAPEEHETHAAEPPPFPTDEGAVEGPVPPGAPPKGSPADPYFGVRYLRIDDDKEPWTRGDPEIYAYYMQRAGTSCQVTYKDLYWVNTERSWYTVWSYLARYFYFPAYSNASYVRIYERDGGTYRVYDLTIDGQTCLYGQRDGDDYVATRWLWKSSYGFNYDYFQDWGNAAVKLRKTN